MHFYSLQNITKIGKNTNLCMYETVHSNKREKAKYVNAIVCQFV